MAPSPAAGKTPNAPKTPTKLGKNPASSATSKLGQSTSAADSPKNTARSATNTPQGAAKGATEKAKSAAPSKPTGSPKLPPRPQGADQAAQTAKDAAPQVTQKAEDVKGKAEDTVEDTKQQAEDTVEGTKEQVEDTAEDTETETPAGKVSQPGDETGAEDSSAVSQSEDATGGAEDAAQGATGALGGVAAQAKDTAEDAQDQAGEAVEDVEDEAGEAADGIEDTAEDAAEGVEDTAEDLEEEAGDAVDGVEDEVDGVEDDVDGAVDGIEDAVPSDAEEAVDGITDQLPVDLSVLKGLEVGEGGEILGADGEPIGKLDEGDPEDLIGKTIGDNGEILDEDGDVIGRASVLPEKAEELAQKARDALPDIGVLEGLEVGEGGEIMGEDGTPLGKVVEGDAEDLVGQKVNDKGEILDEEGDVIGRVEVVPGEAADKINEVQEVADAGGLTPDLSILAGKKINKKGNILDEEGEPIGKLTEDSDLKQCVGKIPNENGEIINDQGDVVGRVEVVPGEAADAAMKELHPELVQKLEEAAEEAAPEIPPLPELDILDGLKVNKKGEVLNEDGEPIARLSEGEIADCAGKKINANGEVLDKEGNVIGKVELIPEAFQEAAEEAVEGAEEAQEAVEEAAPEVDLSILDGLKVNKKGEVVNEDGDPIARLAEGDLEACTGKKINEKGEVLDADGNIIGKVELIPSEPEEEEETGPELPPLSILEGCTCNKQGKVVDADGKPLGQLIEGDAKRLSKSKAECDAEGQFWDGKGNVIGRAETLPQEDDEEEAPFAGLYGLIVVEDGFVEDENENKVGVLVEGDAKKLVGRAVDEDGDVLDKRGNVVGHAERYEEPVEEEAPPPDLSILNGLPVNKQGLVIGPEGVPIARLVEGNAKELAGKKCDGEGQIWNDSGKVIGRCELIPENERESRPEGPFAGLEGLVVVKGGMVEDEDGNTVGQVVEGDPKRLVGRAVDEDGDIVDKYGNVKGHAEPYEEEEPEEVDLSILEGKIVNKSGNVVDEHGTIFGRIVEGDPKALAGRHVDGKGQIWGDTGNIIGQAELIPGGEQLKPEGPFSGFENLVVAKDGLVTDQNGQIVGKVVEGDPEKLLGRAVDDDGDILDKSGNSIGKAERYTPEEKERQINPMSGHKVNSEGEVRDDDGNLIGRLTEGNLGTCIGKEIDDNGYVIDNDGNRVGECTLIENIQEEEEGPTEEELEAMRKKEQDAEIAKKMTYILKETLDKMEPICKNITERIERADRTPKEELDEEQLVQDVKPMLEEGNRILQECNGAIRGLDPDGSIAANAKARAASGEATPEEHALANALKELTTTVVKTIDNAKKRIADMPHAKKELSPLWALLTEPLFQIIAAVGLLLSGVLGLVGKLLNGLGLGGIVNGLLGGLGIDKLLGGLGLGSIGEALGLGGGKKKK